MQDIVYLWALPVFGGVGQNLQNGSKTMTIGQFLYAFVWLMGSVFQIALIWFLVILPILLFFKAIDEDDDNEQIF